MERECDILKRVIYGSAFAITVLGLSWSVQATTLLDNLSATSGGTEAASGTNWIATKFTTNASTYNQLTATIPLQMSVSGSAKLDLYANAGSGLEPGSFISTLTSPASYPTTLTNTSFSASSLSLSASTSYWLVLKATTGTFNWGWTSSDSVLSEWGTTDDSGSTWFTSENFPTQASVTATTVPEPTTVGAMAIVATGLLSRRFRKM